MSGVKNNVGRGINIALINGNIIRVPCLKETAADSKSILQQFNTSATSNVAI